MHYSYSTLCSWIIGRSYSQVLWINNAMPRNFSCEFARFAYSPHCVPGFPKPWFQSKIPLTGCLSRRLLSLFSTDLYRSKIIFDYNFHSKEIKLFQVYLTFWCVVSLIIFTSCAEFWQTTNELSDTTNRNVRSSRKRLISYLLSNCFFSAKSFCPFLIRREKQSR